MRGSTASRALRWLPRRRARRVGVLAFAASAALVGPDTLHAHTALRHSDPAKGSRLTTPPARIALWFTGRPQLPFSRITLTGPAGEVALDRIVADTGNGFFARIPASLSPGDYTVRWQTAGADGHPLRGEFAFTIAGSDAAVATAGDAARSDTARAMPDTAARETPRAESSELRSARWLEFVALLSVLGVLGFRHGVLPPLAARGVPTTDGADRARRLGQSALLLYGIAVLVRLYNQSAAIHGEGAALDPAVVRAMLTQTTWGVGWLVGATGAALVSLGWAISRRSVTIGTPMALTGALGMVLSPALSGHASASRFFVASVTLDMLHVAAAGVWIGGLFIVLVAGIPAMRRLEGNAHAAVSALVNSFHPIALFCAPAVVLAGVGTSWLRLGAVPNLWTTAYGRALLIKLGLVAVVVGLGAYNSMRARRALGTEPATRSFRRSASVELFFAALVVFATTALVVTPFPNRAP